MSPSWSDSSEIALGLILSGRKSVGEFRAEIFQEPYNNIVDELLKNPKMPIEELIGKVGINPVQVAIEAAKSINGLGESNWSKILENSFTAYKAGTKLERIGRKLQQGDEVDWSEINQLAEHVQSGVGEDFRPLSEIEAQPIPFIKTGFKAIDYHLGGLPQIGQVIVGGPPGVGKSTFLVNLTACFAVTHPDKKVAVFTLEMMAEEIKLRYETISKLTKEQQNRILVDDSILTPEQVVNKASTIKDLGLVVIDFADLLIQGEQTEGSTGNIYRTFMFGAKRLRCPFAILSQLSRSYKGGIPRPSDIRWTSLAEALGWTIFMLYNPNNSYFSDENSKDNEVLPAIKNKAYLLAWKMRGGWRAGEIEHVTDNPGAIQIPFRGDMGWKTDEIGKWFNLNKL